MKNRIAFLIGSFIIALLIGFDLYYHMIYFYMVVKPYWLMMFLL
ncbi:hypothetical protein L327_0122020 [Yersinia pestis S3]|nr:hypothetical protein L327_0122020 [Yersinia pestis S3]